MLTPSGELHSLSGFIFYSPVIQTLVKPELLASGYACVLRVFCTKSIFPLGFPRLDSDAPNIHFLLGLWGLRQVAANLFPQAVPGLRYPLPGESDLQEVSQVLLCVDQEGVGGIQPDLLHHFQLQHLRVCPGAIKGDIKGGLDFCCVLVAEDMDFHLIMINSERHACPGFQVHLAVPLTPSFLGVVADAVTTVLPAAETDPLLEAVRVCALESKARLVLIHQGVNEEVHGPLVLTSQLLCDR